MARTDHTAVLEYTVSQVLETMCFFEANSVSDGPGDDCVLGATVPFEGALSGSLRLEVEREAAKRLAASFLGVPELAPESRLAEDTVGELGNVICGRFLSLLYPSESLRMAAPQHDRKPEDSSGLDWHRFEAGGGRLRLAFRIHSTSDNGGR